jgi:hypothetical protein
MALGIVRFWREPESVDKKGESDEVHSESFVFCGGTREVVGVLTDYRNHRKLYTMNDKNAAELRLSPSRWTKARELLSWLFFFVRIAVYAFEKCNRFHQLIIGFLDKFL